MKLTFKTCIGDLGDDVAVGNADDHAILGCIVLVLCLNDQTLPGIVVGLTLTPPLKFDLQISVENKLYEYKWKTHG